MADSSTIDCALTIEWLNKQKSVTKTSKWKSSVLTLIRNEFREIYLQVKVSGATFKFRLENINVHKKFFSEGKATVHFHSHPAILYISNAPASQLLLFLKTIFVKLSSSKSSPKLPLREQLLSNKDRILQEISPINKKDAIRLNDTSVNKPSSSVIVTKRKHMDKHDIQVIKRQCVETLLKEKLTIEQQDVINAVTKGFNIFFTGSAGTGKSFLLRHIIAALPPDRTIATASTGAAACLISGTTLHAFAGIGNGDFSLERCLQLAKRPQVYSNWKRCKHLIIDEISMVDGKYFQKVEIVARLIKNVDRPFGGIQLIVCGDFLQLPPVVPRESTQALKFCFQYPVWKKCQFQVYNLQMVHRQMDSQFIDLLNNIRIGNVTDKIKDILSSTALHTINKENIVPTKLCSHNQEALTINMFELNRLEGIKKQYDSEDSDPSATKLLNDQTPVDSQLVLKVGAQVMLLKNINISRGLVNGARGIVTQFSKEGYPVVRFVSGLEFAISREKWTTKSSSGTTYFRKQIPLKLAWAFSIHKSQGLTLDCVEISLSKVFEAGQAYVALSRAKSLNSLRVIDFDPKQVWADPEVLKFYRRESYNSSIQAHIPLGRK